MFSRAEIIDLAIQIEKNGEKVYRDALEKISDRSLASLLEWLADEEVEHVKWFSDLKRMVTKAPVNPHLEEMGKTMLQRVLGDQTFSLKGVDFSKIEQTEDVIKLAIEFERDTVVFYEMIESFIEDEETLDHLKKIIEEENRHVQVLEELLDSGAVKRGMTASVP
ncbi:MAG: ferritin family protein [Deltaproteobacteria bacterium]|nr:ferritin family protein [Deltaproteobacteria bacterium]